MGMFDTVICEYPLPLPDEAKELNSPPNWDKVLFQTKSIGVDEGGFFGGVMDSYTIEDDGQFYKDVLERDWETDEYGNSFIEERNNGIEKVEFTGDLVFYTMHEEDEYDYWVEFSALFWKGELKEIKLKEWKREDNSSRLETHSKMKKALEAQKKLKNSKEYKIKEFFKKPVRFVFDLVKFILGSFVRLIWWLEQKLL
tara:strand:- start:1941 stop:2534 length:594 start_codon:yes stop_codon:yes gene_type:complete